jgi:hypothetical protein
METASLNAIKFLDKCLCLYKFPRVLGVETEKIETQPNSNSTTIIFDETKQKPAEQRKQIYSGFVLVSFANILHTFGNVWLLLRELKTASTNKITLNMGMVLYYLLWVIAGVANMGYCIVIYIYHPNFNWLCKEIRKNTDKPLK